MSAFFWLNRVWDAFFFLIFKTGQWLLDLVFPSTRLETQLDEIIKLLEQQNELEFDVAEDSGSPDYEQYTEYMDQGPSCPIYKGPMTAETPHREVTAR